ncbi:MAG: hypothetical protein C0418_03045 [Coriobacteriaceae bacterium]|nr:hypothetical protein [Coriobacteriaceae bacterium]
MFLSMEGMLRSPAAMCRVPTPLRNPDGFHSAVYPIVGGPRPLGYTGRGAAPFAGRPIGVPSRSWGEEMTARKLFVLVSCAVFVLAAVTPASAFMADFFEDEASGNAVYEAMVISPEALYDPAMNKTFVAYQGFGLDPYVAEYDHTASRWTTPVAAGDNPQTSDPHGAPAILVDKQGYIHVFYGAHGNELFHSRSTNPSSAASWTSMGTVRWSDGGGPYPIKATYPQPFVSSDGTMTLFYRSGDYGPGSWVSMTSFDSGVTWTQPFEVVRADADNWWYVDFDQDTSDTIHAAAVWKDYIVGGGRTDPSARYGLYYLTSRPATTTWWSITGTTTAVRDKAEMDAKARIEQAGASTRTNQVVVHRSDSATAAGILYLAENGGPGSYQWRFTRWSSGNATWSAPANIAATDQFFDAADFEVSADGTVTAYLTTGGFADENALPNEYALRGGDITRWTSTDASAVSWASLGTLKASPGPWARYNDPQIVTGNGPARVLFCEWDNDFTNYIHKVFLWGPGGFIQREMVPESERIGGTSRAKTSALVSARAFPSGCTTVVIAFQGDYPDALCAVPLAHAYRAPILLVASNTVDSEVRTEIGRLRASKAVLVGGTSVITAANSTAIKGMLTGSSTKVTRISGSDRWGTSAAIAKELRKVRGARDTAILASGHSFADALAVSPYAARKGYPVLLTARDFLPSAIRSQIASIAPAKVMIIGGQAAVGATVVASVEAVGPGTERIAGANRFETSAKVNDYAFDRGLSMERFVLCSGIDFPDALTGGVLAARFNGPVELVWPSYIPTETATQLKARKAGVLDWFVLGGPAAVMPAVETSAAYILYH